MDKLLEQRRQGYLAYFKDGVAGGLMYGEEMKQKRFQLIINKVMIMV